MKIKVTYPDEHPIIMNKEEAYDFFIKRFYNKEPVNSRDINFNPHQFFEELIAIKNQSIATLQGNIKFEVMEND